MTIERTRYLDYKTCTLTGNQCDFDSDSVYLHTKYDCRYCNVPILVEWRKRK